MRKIFLLTFFSQILIGCGDDQQTHEFRWAQSNGNLKRPKFDPQVEKIVSGIQKSAEEKNIGTRNVLRAPQKVFGFRVEETWYQEVKDPEGELLSVNFLVAPSISESVIRSAQYIDAHKTEILEQAFIFYPHLQNSYKILQEEVVFAKNRLSDSAYLKVTLLPKRETEVLQVYISEVGRIRDSKVISHNFTSGSAFVFPNSPEDSNLEFKALRNLKGNGHLESQFLKVESELKPTPYSPENVFQVDSKNKEFDLLQSYYFVDKTMAWFLKVLDVEFPTPLRIKVHIGGAKPTNAAFFYAGKIRLGEGDGKIYKGIPKDPSIVGHEASHAYVQLFSGLSFEGEAGSLSEAFADFFTACSIGRPEMGFYAYQKANYKRSLENTLRADRDLQGKKYNDSLVISGTFWDLKKILGTEKAVDLAYKFLVEAGPGAKILDVPVILRSVGQRNLPSEEWHVIESVLQHRGWIRD